jgi:outer membrane protein OmpA-like peptidoglycan-associated protein
VRASFVIAIVLVAMPALADESGRALIPSIKELVPTVKDLVFTVKPLDLRIEDMIRVTEAAKETTIELPADILFDFDKADIRPEAEVALAAAVEIIRTSAKGTVRIEGHTDAKGAPAYNQKLSLQRAKAVDDWLVAKGGLAKMKFALKGFGATKPVVPNAKPDGSDDPVGRQLNRRVEIIFARK